MGERLVLSFHGLGPVPEWVGADERPYWCDVDGFESVLDLIPEVAESCNLPIEITFDDGNVSDAAIAVPALVDRGLTAAFFVCAGRTGQRGYLDGPAMHEMLSAGMRIGSHGWNHVDWRNVNERDLETEIGDAARSIEEVVGRPVDEVAIPFGSYDRRVISRLGAAGMRTVFTSDGGRAPMDTWLVPREAYTVSWTSSTLRETAARPMSTMDRVKRSLIRRAKRLR